MEVVEQPRSFSDRFCTARNIVISGLVLTIVLIIAFVAMPRHATGSLPTPSALRPSANPNLVPMLVLADVHLDLRYQAGQATEFCARDANQMTAYGAYGCDSPLSLLETALQYAQQIVPCSSSSSTVQTPSSTVSSSTSSSTSSSSMSSSSPCTRFAGIVLVGDLTVHNKNDSPIFDLELVFQAVNTSLLTIRKYFPAPMPLVVTIGNNDVCHTLCTFYQQYFFTCRFMAFKTLKLMTCLGKWKIGILDHDARLYDILCFVFSVPPSCHFSDETIWFI
jgi:hypothetical protein